MTDGWSVQTSKHKSAQSVSRPDGRTDGWYGMVQLDGPAPDQTSTGTVPVLGTNQSAQLGPAQHGPGRDGTPDSPDGTGRRTGTDGTDGTDDGMGDDDKLSTRTRPDQHGAKHQSAQHGAWTARPDRTRTVQTRPDGPGWMTDG